MLIYGVCFPTWPLRADPSLWWVFIRLSKGYRLCDRLSSSCRRMLNLPNTRRTTQRWQSFGPAVFGQAGKKNTVYDIARTSSSAFYNLEMAIWGLISIISGRNSSVRFETLMVVNVKITFSWNLTPHNFVTQCQHFRETYLWSYTAVPRKSQWCSNYFVHFLLLFIFVSDSKTSREVTIWKA